ncbi:unnamed protein product [Dicrocoelium dendriticum]|nr:unnamed protein product [Dicrocoelium dendriticum]CAI2738930.1 unnamed protein product [Dicrocoelium dendriticum]
MPPWARPLPGLAWPSPGRVVHPPALDPLPHGPPPCSLDSSWLSSGSSPPLASAPGSCRSWLAGPCSWPPPVGLSRWTLRPQGSFDSWTLALGLRLDLWLRGGPGFTPPRLPWWIQ